MTKHGFRKRFSLILAAGKEFYHRIPYFAIASVCIYLLLFLGIRAYYRYMPASWFIHVQGIPHIDNGQVGSDLTLTFCRTTRYPNIKAVGIRSFYYIVGNNEQPAQSYTFSPTIQRQKACQYLTLTPDKHPEKAGTYIAHTDLTFYVDGHKKVLEYDTNTFVISDTKQSLEQQIQKLENEIKGLKGQESAIIPTSVSLPSSTSTPDQVTAPSTTSTTEPSEPASTPQPTPPPTAARPKPDPNAIQHLLTTLTGGLL